MPPSYLLSKETAVFNKSDNAFCNMNLENIKLVLSLESNKVTTILAYKKDDSQRTEPRLDKNASDEVRSALEKIIDVIETDQLDLGICGKRKNILEEDLYLSSEENDPNLNSQESKQKKRKKINFENNYKETDTSFKTDQKNKTARKISKKAKTRTYLEQKDIIKSARNQGQKYTNWQGKKQLARKIKKSCEENCGMKFDEEKKKKEGMVFKFTEKKRHCRRNNNVYRPYKR
ncbi:unnamed protein product [Acanthoscelides obtectus]|uniref:Uncharacterized protein n=1 Tax=Acanthoscelides obtectus TaxID=200917 RepID=A0A9P0MEN6_ACAOB|nr:unnamed protein product [Acanthoscelides obtectus]CAK1677774.1 hypothetical protein AOBTE_LOCUS31548 [Acanthoscelides obtectus]